MGKKTVFIACGAVALGTVGVILMAKNKTIQEKWGNLLRRFNSIGEEELPPVELWVLINRLGDGCSRAPAEQAVVVIKNQTLQKLNNCKWVSSSLKLKQRQSYITVSNPHFCQVKPSMQCEYVRAVCDSSLIYLIGGLTLLHHFGERQSAYCIDAAKVVSRRTTEEENSRELSSMLESSIVRGAALTKDKMIYAFSRMEFFDEESESDDESSSSSICFSFGEIYNIEANRWMSLDKAPFRLAPLWDVIGCVMWDSMNMIVLFLVKEEKLKEGRADGKLYVQAKKVCFYDLKEEKWVVTVKIEDDDVHLWDGCNLVLVGDDVFIVHGTWLYRYSLNQKRITGKNEKLQEMEMEKMPPNDVVYLSSSDDKKFHKFCIFWDILTKGLYFALIKVGDDGEDKLTVRLSSSVGRIPLKRYDRLIKCTHAWEDKGEEDIEKKKKA